LEKSKINEIESLKKNLRAKTSNTVPFVNRKLNAPEPEESTDVGAKRPLKLNAPEESTDVGAKGILKLNKYSETIKEKFSNEKLTLIKSKTIDVSNNIKSVANKNKKDMSPNNERDNLKLNLENLSNYNSGKI